MGARGGSRGARPRPRAAVSARGRLRRRAACRADRRSALAAPLLTALASLDGAHRLTPASWAWRSISASSSSLNSSWSSAAAFSSSCSTLDAPSSADVTRGSRSVRDRHLREPLAAALGDLVQRAHAAATFSSLRKSREKVILRRARVLGHAVEVLLGQHPLGEQREDDAADALLEHVEQPRLDQRFSSEYEGWWISTGVPSSRRIAAASRRCSRSSE